MSSLACRRIALSVYRQAFRFPRRWRIPQPLVAPWFPSSRGFLPHRSSAPRKIACYAQQDAPPIIAARATRAGSFSACLIFRVFSAGTELVSVGLLLTFSCRIFCACRMYDPLFQTAKFRPAFPLFYGGEAFMDI
jgi:hypothetical protein